MSNDGDVSAGCGGAAGGDGLLPDGALPAAPTACGSTDVDAIPTSAGAVGSMVPHQQVEPRSALWAQVEIFGHRKHFGRVSEITRFGIIFVSVEIPTTEPGMFRELFYAPSSIFSITPCDEATARRLGSVHPGTGVLEPSHSSGFRSGDYDWRAVGLEEDEE